MVRAVAMVVEAVVDEAGNTSRAATAHTKPPKGGLVIPRNMRSSKPSIKYRGRQKQRASRIMLITLITGGLHARPYEIKGESPNL